MYRIRTADGERLLHPAPHRTTVYGYRYVLG